MAKCFPECQCGRHARLSVDERFWVKVEKAEGCWLWTGAAGTYGHFGWGGRTVDAHRVAYELTYGPIPEGAEVDHRCLVKLCVRPTHLRLATRKQNTEHLGGARSDSKTGVRGVFPYRDGTFQAWVGHEGKSFWVGRFDTVEQAEAAVIAKRNELFTHNDVDRMVLL